MKEIRLRPDEICSVRDAMRELGRLLDRIESGELEKLVLTQRNQVRAVVIPIDQFAEVQPILDRLRQADSDEDALADQHVALARAA